MPSSTGSSLSLSHLLFLPGGFLLGRSIGGLTYPRYASRRAGVCVANVDARGAVPMRPPRRTEARCVIREA